MALDQLHKVVARPVSLGDDAAVQDNTSGIANSLIDADTVKGVLGGSVAAIDTDGTYKACSPSDLPVGLFGIDAAGEPFESNRPKDHGKITLVSGGFHAVDIYETRNEADGADLTYSAGDLLYCSARGLLSNDAALDTNTAVAVVEEAGEIGEALIIKLLV